MDSSAAGKQPHKSMEQAVENLKIDSTAETRKPNLPSTKDASSSDDASCVSSGSVRDRGINNRESSTGAQGLYYYGYAYPGYNDFVGELHDSTYFVGTNGLEYFPAVMQTDGSYVYYLPDINNQTGYYYTSPTPSLDGQYYSPTLISPTDSYSPEWFPTYTSWDQYLLLMNGIQGTTVTGKPVSNKNNKIFTQKGSPSSQEHSSKAGNNKGIGNATSNSGIIRPTNFPELKITKPKSKPKFNNYNNNNNNNTNILTTREKNVTVTKDIYNRADFPTKYENAVFFVIKSYSEDDVHKSIKYGVWSSTPNGNKRLDGAFKTAREMAEKGTKCPVFLFFSVNASGQFCGVAEMEGPVDFTESMDFWQQDKWTGFFPVKWHIIKDVPNPQFRHIILENNENKPVTNSRDTQEVKFSQGIEVLKIFKNYSNKTSILDDFEFYENRQKAMQGRQTKPLNLSTNQPPSVETEEEISDGAKIGRSPIKSN